MIRTGILLVAMGGVSAWGAMHEHGVVKPQQQIKVTQNAWGCLSKSGLDAALSQERAGQPPAKQQAFGNGQCVSVPAGQPFRVVSVERRDVEFVNAANTDQQGLWIDSRFIAK